MYDVKPNLFNLIKQALVCFFSKNALVISIILALCGFPLLYKVSAANVQFIFFACIYIYVLSIIFLHEKICRIFDDTLTNALFVILFICILMVALCIFPFTFNVKTQINAPIYGKSFFYQDHVIDISSKYDVVPVSQLRLCRVSTMNVYYHVTSETFNVCLKSED